MDISTMAAMYVLASPREQERDERNATERRIQLCLLYAHEQGYITRNIYQDVGHTWQERKGFDDLKKAMLQQEFSVVIVTDLNQIHRDTDALAQFLEEAKNAGVSIFSIARPPFGYKWNADHTALAWFPEEAKQIKDLFDAYK